MGRHSKNVDIPDLIERANHTRYRSGQSEGHYESYFQRANHPTQAKAFWIRYTIFTPLNRPAEAIGEKWAIYFDGVKNEHIVAKQEVPIGDCSFDRSGFAIDIAGSKLERGKLTGTIESSESNFSWDLKYTDPEPPLFLFPHHMYDAPFPKAKVLVGAPLAVYNGKLIIGDKTVGIKDWVGSQNHNWGSKHTDLYSWGQVAGFDDAPDTFLEISTARLKYGPLWTPRMTVAVVRHEGRELPFNKLSSSFGKGGFGYFYWHFFAESDEAIISGRIEASPDDFVGLRYYNPPGGIKSCLNSKIASCELLLTIKGTTPKRFTLKTKNRAAFEILTDATDHGIKLRA
jgi:hypothetical protein